MRGVLLLMLWLVSVTAQLEEVDLTCIYCNASVYCTGGQRYACPSNSLSVDFGSEIEDCICLPGFHRTQPDACVVGTVPYYYYEGQQIACPVHKETTAALASSVSDCVCKPGFDYGASYRDACVSCRHGTYADTFNTSTCYDCPDNSWHTNTRAVSVTACACVPGHTGPDGGPCLACEAGKFKGHNGSDACATCAVNEYSLSAATTCLDCPLNSQSEPGAGSFLECLCDPGYELDGVTCDACGIGFYKDTAGSSACLACPADTRTATTASVVCEPCPANADPRHDLLTCDCVDGYGHVGAADADVPNCQACAVGEYYTAASSGPPTQRTGCVACPGNSTTQATASAALLDCFCNAGFVVRDDVHACVACEPGKYKSTTGFDHDAVCVLCPANSFSEAPASADATACECNAGYSGPHGGPCEACAAGKFKAARGSEACENCAADTYSDAPASTACKDCIDNSLSPVGSPSLDSCVCDHTSGWSEKQIQPGEDRECVNCEAGKYVNPYSACEVCEVGEFTPLPGATVCLTCADNTTSLVNETANLLPDECVCVAGFRCPGGLSECDGNCVACPRDTFKDTVGYAAACEACPANSQSLSQSVSVDACQCNEGYRHITPDLITIDAVGCEGCAPGSYANVVGALQCSACPQLTFTDPASFPFTDAAECLNCTVCPFNTRDVANGDTGCGLGSDSVCEACASNSGNDDSLALRNARQCACNHGFFGPINGPCTQCELGKYTLQPRSVDQETADERCLDCDGYTGPESKVCLDCLAYAEKPALAWSKHHCQCIAGHTSGDADIRAALLAEGGTTLALDYVLPLHFRMVAGLTDVIYVGTSHVLDNVLATACPRCDVGKFKAVQGNQPCSLCSPETHGPVRGLAACADCPANMNQPQAGQQYCHCNAGFEPNGDGACQPCADAKYQPHMVNSSCVACDVCGVNEQVATVCNSTHNIACKPCQPNSHADARSELGVCLCNAGYELVGEECIACDVGKFRRTDLNNSVKCATCPPLTFTDSIATTECFSCTASCADDAGLRYVQSECTPERDIICADCTLCSPGNYANNTCGLGYGNDRRDTQCAECIPGFYCPGGGQGLLECFEHSTSHAGASARTDCFCVAGFYLQDGACPPCPHDTYCTGNNVPTACPNNSFTYLEGSSHRLDCQCQAGFYRLGDETSFECPVCTVNDYCFNNSRFNCSDPRMVSDAGSDAHADCVCIAGFYNNHTRCQQCPAQHFCPGDKTFNPCPANEWTNDLTGYSECVCRPGFFRSADQCVPCTEDFFCSGVLDERKACPANSQSPAGSALITDCACDAGYENSTVAAANGTVVQHICVLCAHGVVKESNGNHACRPCTVCRPAVDGVHEISACRPAQDAVCSPCDPCTVGDVYISQPCASTTNAVCSECTKCDFAVEYQELSCTPAHNRICQPISFTRPCAVGEYAGGHTNTSDSRCLACRYLDQLYFGWRLHLASSSGQVYNDPYSCRVQCTENAVLVDPGNHSRGCRSCESGNVLLKTLIDDPNDLECQFECRSGYYYDQARGDCYVAALTPTERTSFTHQIAVSDFSKTAAGFTFTVVHTNHSRFLLVVGKHAPTSCKLSECCWGGLWRVSTLAQMGAVADNCSNTPALDSHTVDQDVLQFSVPEDELPQVANCSFVGLQRRCELVISIIDTVLRQSYSRTVEVHTERAVDTALLSGPKRIMPLTLFSVQVLKAYHEGDHDVYILITAAASAGPTYNVTARGSGMTLEPYPQPCERVQLAHNATASQLVGGEVVTTVSYWRASRDSEVLRWFYTLDGGNGDVMDIAAVRNVSNLEPMCTAPVTPASFTRGHVEAAAGLGAEAVERGRVAGLYTHGELGTLLTFFGFASDPAVTTVTPHSALAAHVTQVSFIGRTGYEGCAFVHGSFQCNTVLFFLGKVCTMVNTIKRCNTSIRKVQYPFFEIDIFA